MFRSIHSITTVLIFFIFLILPGQTSAQSFWLDHEHSKSISIEIYKTTKSGAVVIDESSYPADYAFDSFAGFLSTRWPISSKMFVVAELPFIRASYNTKIDDEFSYFRSEGHGSAIGNTYIGLERQFKNTRWCYELGVRLQLIGNDYNFALGMAEYTDRYRVEAFKRLTTIKGLINYRRRWDKGYTLHLQVGPYCQRDLTRSSNLGLGFHFNVKVGYETDRFHIGLNSAISFHGFSRWTDEPVTEMYNQSKFPNLKGEGAIRINASLKLGNYRPGILFSPSGSAFGLYLTRNLGKGR